MTGSAEAHGAPNRYGRTSRLELEAALGALQLANFHQVREPARPRNLICHANRFCIREVQRALKTCLMELCAPTEFNKALWAVQYIKHGLRRAERLLSCKCAARVLGIAAPSIR